MKIFSKSLSVAFMVLLFFCTSVYAHEEEIRTQVAAGAYHISGSPLPLLLVSNNQGQTWTFVQHISDLPSENYTAMISSTSCNELFCCAVGSGFTQTPLLISRDKGQSWFLIPSIAGLPQSKTQALSSVSCTNAGCVAVGIYENKTGSNQPLLITSDTSGQSWNFVENIANLPARIDDADLTSVNCTGHNCVAVGHYEVNKLLYPLLVVSNDNGFTWTFIKNISGFSSQLKSTDLKTVNCADNICITAGKYNNGETDLPLLIVSKDNGNTWKMIRNVTGIPQDLKDGIYSSISCSKNSCIVVGSYHDETSFLPLLIRSNNGEDWSIVHNLINLPRELVGAEISSVSCTTNFCVAAGYYSIGGTIAPYFPMLLISNNFGHSWMFVRKIQDLPTQSAVFHAISCSENSCTAAGEYYHITDSNLPPPLVVSTNRGESWQFIQNISSIPSKLKSAEVFTLTDSVSGAQAVKK